MTKRVLSIDPGTRFWGVTVFNGGEIVTAAVKVLTGASSRQQRLEEARKVFLSLVEDHAPGVLVIESPLICRSKQLKFLGGIVGEIKRLAKKEKMKIYEYSAQTVRKTICGNEKAAKADAAEAVCQIYPELKNRLDQEKKSRKLYWFHLFDSTALGLCWLKKRGKISLPAKT